MKITGYADKISARPGETVHFMVNCELPEYRAEVVRIVCGDENPAGPGVKERRVRTAADGVYPGRRQTIESGSYAVVTGPDGEAGRSVLDNLKSFSVQAMIWPTTPQNGTQVLVSKWQDRRKSGFALLIHEGVLALQLGDGGGNVETVGTNRTLLERKWYFVAATHDANSGRVTLYQEPQHDYPTVADRGVVRRKVGLAHVGTNDAPLMFAGRRVGAGRLAHKFNGKIDSPRLANVALDRAALEMLKHGVSAGLQDAVVGTWDFSRDISSAAITDVSPNRLHGRTVNMPARGMTGADWTGESMDWKQTPEHYGAIHFHDDDLYDAGWEVDFSLTVPARLKSGLYAARLRADGADGDLEEEYVPFVVKPAKGKEKPLAFLLPTASYMAYANDHMTTNAGLVELVSGRLPALDKYALFLNEHREYGASCYDSHADGSGVCYSSRLRPILNMRPKHIHGLGGHGSSLWQFNADTHITDWLEARGYDFDVITDEDLHAEGLDILKPYRAILTGSHPEYHSLQMWDAMQAYQQQGGRLMYMGANGWYWRIAYHPEYPGLMEVRRNEGGIRTWRADTGEYYHSFTGEYGGLWRNQRRPPQTLLGVGFSAQGFDVSAPYHRLPDSFDKRAAFIFEGIDKDEVIGDFGLIGGGAAGLEIDRADPALGTPPHTLVLATSLGGHTDVYLVVCEELLVTVPGLGGTENELVRADMVFFETPNGGAVWSSGSIAWAGSLSHNGYDNNVSRITGNVLDRFLDPAPFVK